MEIGAAIDTALRVKYLQGGRDLDGWDCWGAVRWLYAQHSGIWMPAFPALCHKESITTQRAARAVRLNVEPCGFEPWALAAQYQNKTWTHIGLVLPDRTIIHACPNIKRTTIHRRRQFEMLSLTTRYYRWKPE